MRAATRPRAPAAKPDRVVRCNRYFFLVVLPFLLAGRVAAGFLTGLLFVTARVVFFTGARFTTRFLPVAVHLLVVAGFNAFLYAALVLPPCDAAT